MHPKLELSDATGGMHCRRVVNSASRRLWIVRSSFSFGLFTKWRDDDRYQDGSQRVYKPGPSFTLIYRFIQFAHSAQSFTPSFSFSYKSSDISSTVILSRARRQPGWLYPLLVRRSPNPSHLRTVHVWHHLRSSHSATSGRCSRKFLNT